MHSRLAKLRKEVAVVSTAAPYYHYMKRDETCKCNQKESTATKHASVDSSALQEFLMSFLKILQTSVQT